MFLRLVVAFALVLAAGEADARGKQAKRDYGAYANAGVMNARDLTQTDLPVDGTATVNGIEMGCTGIGLEARERGEWKRFSVRVEFSGSYRQYIPGGRLVVKTWEGRKPIVNVRCDAPWILLDLEPGKYRVGGVMAGYSKPQSWIMRLKPNRKNTRRIVLHFDEVTGSDP
ncbi:MAG: hypothetical protein ACT4OG_03810 [Alphaproteobacteria bacterium]